MQPTDAVVSKHAPSPTALVTGGARRIGAAIVRALHRAGMNLALHYHTSVAQAEALQAELNALRPDSVILLQADLRDTARLPVLVEQTAACWGNLELLVNNASAFYPTVLGEANESQWDDILGSNLKAPFFLAQAAAPYLRATGGNIINIIDIHAHRPLENHSIYCAAKAGLAMLTRSLAWELRPHVRVNGISPGAILWPQAGASEDHQAAVLSEVALGRLGDPGDIARTLLFLVRDGGYITGQIITVDGGRTLSNP